MTNAFEYGDALLPPPEEEPVPELNEQGGETPPSVPTNQPYLNLATCVHLPTLSNYLLGSLTSIASQVPHGSARR
jgi:hypothetical protein